MKLHLLLIASLAVASGCTSSSDESADVDPVASEGALDQACPNRQVVPLLSKPELRARYQRFLSRNEGQWNPSPADWSWDATTGALAFAYRTDAMGAAVPALPKHVAEEDVRTFVAHNWDLLGYRSESAAAHAAVSASAAPPQYSGGGFAWSVQVVSEEPQTGFEAIADATQRLHLIVDVAKDGTIRQFTSVDTNRLPFLTMRPTPRKSADVARAAVLGVPLTYRPGPYEPDWGEVFSFGSVTPSDIVSTQLTLRTEWGTGTASSFASRTTCRYGGPARRRTFSSTHAPDDVSGGRASGKPREPSWPTDTCDRAGYVSRRVIVDRGNALRER